MRIILELLCFIVTFQQSTYTFRFGKCCRLTHEHQLRSYLCGTVTSEHVDGISLQTKGHILHHFSQTKDIQYRHIYNCFLSHSYLLIEHIQNDGTKVILETKLVHKNACIINNVILQ